MMVEDKILEYLDGSLGAQESAELLETLSLSPEKRALLEEHLRLKDLLTLGRKPFSVPMETERSLARQIPILGKYNEDLAPFMGPFTALRSWIGARAIGLAVGAGAMIMLAGLGWFAMHGTGKNIVPAGSSASPSVSSSMMRDGAIQPPQHMTPDAPHAIASNLPAATAAQAILRSQHIARSIANSDLHSPSPTASPALEIAANDIQQCTAARQPTVTARAIPIGGHFAMTMNELLLPQPKDLSRLSMGGSFILNESYLPTLSTGPSRSLTMLTGDATIDYDIWPSFSIGLDFGDAVGSSLTNASNFVLAPGSDYSRLIQSPNVSNEILYDLLVATHLTLFPESEYQIRIGAEGGDAFGAGPIVEATAGISRVLAPGILLDLTAIGSRLWTSGNSANANPPLASGVVGIVGGQARSAYTTAFGISAGFRVRLP